MSFLGVLHEGLVIYMSVLVLMTLSMTDSLFLTFIDLITINVLNIILALSVSSKDDDFFE